MKRDEIDAVLNATMQLSDSARIALGRMAGVSLRSAMTSTRGRNAVLSFMALFPPEVYEKTSKFERTILFFPAAPFVRRIEMKTVCWLRNISVVFITTLIRRIQKKAEFVP